MASQLRTQPKNITNHHKTATYSTYDVTCFGHHVRTIVTSCPNVVTKWITHIRSNNPSNIVGLDTEGLNPIKILQLCVGPNCLIYKLFHTTSIPPILVDFLKESMWKFSGVGVSGDHKRLLRDYDMGLGITVDVSKVAAEADLVRANAGLKAVTKAVLGWEMEKVKEITMSKWEKENLDDSQVVYACVDAFVGYHIGKKLIVGDECVHDHCIHHQLFGDQFC